MVADAYGIRQFSHPTHDIPQTLLQFTNTNLHFISTMSMFPKLHIDRKRSRELCGTSMYTDDTAIFYMADNEKDLQMSLQYDLQSTAVWMRENRLSLSTSKMKFMMLGSKARRSKARPFTLSLNGDGIDTITTFKYLGMYSDNNLHFHADTDKNRR